MVIVDCPLSGELLWQHSFVSRLGKRRVVGDSRGVPRIKERAPTTCVCGGAGWADQKCPARRMARQPREARRKGVGGGSLGVANSGRRICLKIHHARRVGEVHGGGGVETDTGRAGHGATPRAAPRGMNVAPRQAPTPRSPYLLLPVPPRINTVQLAPQKGVGSGWAAATCSGGLFVGMPIQFKLFMGMPLGWPSSAPSTN